MEKIRYEIDPFNRIVASGGGSGLPAFRKVVDGCFRAGEDGTLTYNVKSPLSDSDIMPNQVRIKGEWSLTDNYDLRLTLDEASRKTFGNRITFQGEVLDAKDDALLFAVTTATKDKTRSTYVLNLQGVWKADENNCLSFHIKKEAGAADVLTFNGAWGIDKDHQIIYQYEKSSLARKKKKVHTVLFKGHWDIKNSLRISYVLEGGSESSFDFSAAMGIMDKRFIKYEVAIGVARKRDPDLCTVSLSGRWSLKKDVGLVFEVRYENGRIGEIVFGANAALTDRGAVSFRLKDALGHNDIGVELELTREICSGDGEAFLRVLRTGKECALYAGAAWRW